MDGLSLHLAKGRRTCSRSCSSLNDRMGERDADAPNDEMPDFVPTPGATQTR